MRRKCERERTSRSEEQEAKHLRKEVPESVEVAGERVRVSEEEVREPDRLSALPSQHGNRSKNG
jgi:hypothetical protein